jgi:hypothetical protein
VGKLELQTRSIFMPAYILIAIIYTFRKTYDSITMLSPSLQILHLWATLQIVFWMGAVGMPICMWTLVVFCIMKIKNIPKKTNDQI